MQYEVIYNAKFVEDTIKMTMGREDRFILKVGEEYAYGYGHLEYYMDSLARTPEGMLSLSKSLAESHKTGMPFWSSCIGGARLYKNYRTKKLSVIDNVSTLFFIYEEDLKPQNWIIKDDTMTVAGYPCQKAICDWRGRDWVVWFTSGIPISEGPWKFNGLPGLITKLYDTKHHYEFDLVVLKKIDEKINIQPLFAKEFRRLIFRYTLSKIERKPFLEIKFGERGQIIRDADMAKIGLSSERADLKYGYIELDY